MFNEKLCVGYQSGFSLIHIYMDEKSQSELPWIHNTHIVTKGHRDIHIRCHFVYNNKKH